MPVQNRQTQQESFSLECPLYWLVLYEMFTIVVKTGDICQKGQDNHYQTLAQKWIDKQNGILYTHCTFVILLLNFRKRCCYSCPKIRSRL